MFLCQKARYDSLKFVSGFIVQALDENERKRRDMDEREREVEKIIKDKDKVTSTLI